MKCGLTLDGWRLSPLAAVLAIVFLAVPGLAQEPGELAGNYLLTLDRENQKPRVNIEIADGKVRSVRSTDKELEGMNGDVGRLVSPDGISAFLVRMRNAKYTISQIWIVRKDGNIVVREVPDRGEMQLAVPVAGDTVEPIE